MAVIVSLVVSYFTYWMIGAVIGIYWLSRIWFRKQVTITPRLPQRRKKRIERMRGDIDEEDRQLLHRYGAHDHLVDEERFNSLD